MLIRSLHVTWINVASVMKQYPGPVYKWNRLRFTANALITLLFDFTIFAFNWAMANIGRRGPRILSSGYESICCSCQISADLIEEHTMYVHLLKTKRKSSIFAMDVQSQTNAHGYLASYLNPLNRLQSIFHKRQTVFFLMDRRFRKKLSKWLFQQHKCCSCLFSLGCPMQNSN